MPKQQKVAPHLGRRPLKLVVEVEFLNKPCKQQKKKEKEYGTPLAKERGAVRTLLEDDLRMYLPLCIAARVSTDSGTHAGAITGNQAATMWWNAEDFFTHIASVYGVCLQGWPPHLLFANLSRVRGGIRVMRDLTSRIECGTLKFTVVPPDQLEELTVESAAPGKFVPRPPRAVRRDYGKPRVLPWLRRSRPPRYMRTGPKSSESIEDSDAYNSEPEEPRDDVRSVGSWDAAAKTGGDVSEIESASGFDN